MIAQRALSLLSNRLAAMGGRRMREDVLERDYCLAWFLAVLAQSGLKEELAFKGGTALKRCYFGDYRFSEDLDFTRVGRLTPEDLRSRLEAVYTEVYDQSGIRMRFEREDRLAHANSYTFFLEYDGPLPRPNTVKVDVTLSECLVHPLVERPVLKGYEEFSDVPEGRLLRVYPLEEIASEKIIALADPARNEPRDLYDLWYLAHERGVELSPLSEAVRRKLAFRGRPCRGLRAAVEAKEARLKILWTRRLDYHMSHLPPFDSVFHQLCRALRQADLP